MSTHFLWFVFISTAAAYGSTFAIQNTIVADESDAGGSVQIMDHVSPGVHRLTGMMKVPKSCDQLEVRVSELGKSTFQLQFVTWEEPTIPCHIATEYRSFTATAFAPAVGINFLATLDDAPIDIHVIPRLPKEQREDAKY